MSEYSIAPHRNKELELVLSGDKPLGSVKVDSPDSELVLVQNKLYKHIANGIVYFAMTPEPIQVYKFLQTPALAGIIVHNKQEHQGLMGRLFGYTDEQIEEFMEANVDCSCVDCQGMGV